MSDQSRYWYNGAENEAHKRLQSVCAHLEMQSSQRWAEWQKYELIYQDRYWHTTARPNTTNTARPKHIGVNRARLAVETYKSKLLKSRVLPVAIVKEGDWDLRQRAHLHNLFMEGAFDQLGIYDQDALWADDCCINGTYWAHGYLDGDEPVIDRVDPYEVLIDENDWQYRNGRSIHRRKLFDRGVAMELWPDSADAIEKAKTVEPESYLLREQGNTLVDQIVVTYSWHRRSGPEAKDGRRVVWIDGATLEEDYEADLDELPWAWGWNTIARRGMWGHPLMADLWPLQDTHNKWMSRIDQAMWLMSVPRILLKGEATKIAVEKITNGIGDILKITGPGAIETWNSDGISPQAFQFVKGLEDSIQVMGRTSLLSTQGEVPKNIRAYQALKLLEDTDQEGLREPMRFRDTFFVRIAKLLVDLFEQVDGFSLMVKNKRVARDLKFKDVKLKENQYRWVVMPTDFKAKSAAARMDQAEHLVEMKLLPPDAVADFVDIPDVETEGNLITAQRDNIMYRIGRIMSEGERGYIPPHGYIDLGLLRTMVGNQIARCEADGAPAEVITLLDKLVTEATAAQKATPVTPGAQVGTPGAPTAAPLQAPQPGMPNPGVSYSAQVPMGANGVGQ